MKATHESFAFISRHSGKALLTALLCLLLSKSHAQMLLWPFPQNTGGQQMNFTSNTLQNLLYGNYNSGPTTKCHAMMHKSNGEPWFMVRDHFIYDNVNGEQDLFDISTGGQTPSATFYNYYLHASEVAIVPVPGQAASFFIIYPGFYYHVEGCGLNGGVLIQSLPGNNTSYVELTPGPNFISPQALNFANGIAITEKITDFSGEYYLMFIHDIDEVFTYKIEATGINFLNSFSIATSEVHLTNDLISEMEVVKRANGNFLISFSLPHPYTGGGANPPAHDSFRIWLYEVTASGTLVQSKDIEPFGTIPITTWPSSNWRQMIPKGMEFSANGRYLYYTAAQNLGGSASSYAQNLFYIDISQGIQNSSAFEYPSSVVGADFRYGMLEMAVDKSIYVHGGNRMGRINIPNSPQLSYFIDNAIQLATTIPFAHDASIPYFERIRSLPDQIDGFDYNGEILTLPDFIVTGNNWSCTNNMQYQAIPTDPALQYTWNTNGIGWNLSGSGSGTTLNSIPPQGGTITFTQTDPASGCFTTEALEIYPCCQGSSSYNWNNFLDQSAAYIALNQTGVFYIDAATSSSLLQFTGNYIASSFNPNYQSSPEIVINGRFDVDINVHFKKCRILLGPNAEIVIHPGKQLTIETCFLSGCDGFMWDKIFSDNAASSIFLISSRMEDAQKAVYVQNGSSVSSDAVVFNKNHKSFLIENSLATQPLNVIASQFLSVDQSNVNASNCLPPFSSQKSYTGIEIKNVNNVTVGNSSASGYLNTFRNLEHGIFIENSSSTIYNNSFEDIQGITQSLTGNGELNAISAVGNNTNSFTLTVGGTGNYQKNTFSNCINGIYCSRGMNAMVVKNSFENIRNQIAPSIRSNAVCIRNASGIDVYIFDNSFNNTGWQYYQNNSSISGINTGNGILIRDVMASTIDITTNKFNTTLTGSSGNCAIALENNGALENAENITTVSGNTIQNSRCGIQLLNYDKTQIGPITNEITLPNPAPTAGVFYGVRMLNSHSNKLISNNIGRSQSASVPEPSQVFEKSVYGVSHETSDRNFTGSNNFRKLGSGIRYFRTGLNMVQCNLLYHNWNGVLIQGSDIGDQGDYSLDPEIAQDNYWDDLPGGQFNKDLLGESPTYTAKWYAQQIQPGYLPSQGDVDPANWLSFPTGDPTNACTNPLREGQQERMAYIAQQEGDFALLAVSEQYQLLKQVFLTLRSDETWMSLGTPYDQVLDAFYDSVLTTPLGELESVRDLMITNPANAASVVNSVVTGNSPEWNERVVFEILLQLSNSGANPDDVQQEALYNIAIQNPIYGGRGVYWAREILQINLDDENVLSNSRVLTNQPICFRPAEPGWTIFPNPNNGVFTLMLPETFEPGTHYSIFNLSGQEELSGIFDNSNKSVQIDATSLTKGLYIVRIFNSSESFIKKLIISAN